MDERCTCRRCVRETASRVASCRPLRKRRVCAGARVSLMQWQDWRSGGRDLRRAPWRDARMGARVRFVAEKASEKAIGLRRGRRLRRGC
eukprot:1997909-Prymnesium_polylepis.1